MKLPKNAPKSSFGIPEEQREAMEAHRAQQRSGGEAEPEDAAPETETDDGFDLQQQKRNEDEMSAKLDPEKIFKDLGVEVTEDDIHSLIFKGTLQKEVTVVKAGSRDLKASFRLMTGEEYEECDELHASEMQDTPMTFEGRDTRKNMWQLSYGVALLNGRELVPPPKPGENFDRRALIIKKRKVLSQMNPGVLNKMMVLYGRFVLAVNRLLEEPDSPLFSKPSTHPEGRAAAN